MRKTLIGAGLGLGLGWLAWSTWAPRPAPAAPPRHDAPKDMIIGEAKPIGGFGELRLIRVPGMSGITETRCLLYINSRTADATIHCSGREDFVEPESEAR